MRLLMHVPVPWVFVLAYLLGAGLEHVWPPGLGGAPLGVGVAGGVVFVLGAAIAAWSLLVFHRARTTVPGEPSAAGPRKRLAGALRTGTSRAAPVAARRRSTRRQEEVCARVHPMTGG